MSEGRTVGEGRGAGVARDAPETPEGYRRTEVGVIPEDWEMRSLRSVLAECPSYGINAPAVPFDGSLPTYIRITDIGSDGRFKPTPRVAVNGVRATHYLLRPGDLVFARTGASVGKSYLYDRRDGPLVFAGFLIRVTPDPSLLLPAFIAHYAQTQSYWDWIADNSGRSGQPGVNSKEYGSLPVPIPPLREQRAIAAVLMDVDALLGSLEALIAKKRAVRQAAMQQLLTGRTRLPGFERKWGTMRLGECVRIRGDRVPSSKAGGGTLCVELENIEQATGRLLRRELASSVSAKYSFETGDVLFGRLRPYLRKWWRADQPGVCSTEIWPLVSDPLKADNRFIYWLIQADTLSEAAQVSYGTHMPRADWKVVSEVPVPCPPIPEQRAIAAVLSDMDSEIAALERRFDKTRALKKGMMQQLLTGAIRLPIPKAAAENEPGG